MLSGLSKEYPYNVCMTNEALKAWRVAHGLSQAQMAAALPVKLSTLQEWESARGKGRPPAYFERVLRDLARELSQPVDQHTEPPARLDPVPVAKSATIEARPLASVEDVEGLPDLTYSKEEHYA